MAKPDALILMGGALGLRMFMASEQLEVELVVASTRELLARELGMRVVVAEEGRATKARLPLRETPPMKEASDEVL